MQMFWFLPTTGDGRYLGDSRQARETNLPYLRQIASAIDELGFEGVLLPTGNLCEDAWVVASSVMPFTRRSKLRRSIFRLYRNRIRRFTWVVLPRRLSVRLRSRRLAGRRAIVEQSARQEHPRQNRP